MQIIVNCFTPYEDGFVMLQKPRRGWWVLPGGKVDIDETWPNAAKREMLEEAGLLVDHLQLRGVHLLHIASEKPEEPPMRRLIAQFSATSAGGQLLDMCKEGKVEIITPARFLELPMDEGDRIMVSQTLKSVQEGTSQVHFGSFRYDTEHRLLDWSMDAQSER